MDLFTTSFITKQKLANNSFAVTGRNYANNFVVSNVAATHIFDQYLFREDAIYTSSVPSCTYEEPTFFSNFLRLSALSHANLTIAFPDNHKLDIFGFFITVQLAFKVNHSVILARPNDLAFFCYYNKAFASGGSGISYSFDVNKQLICATKQSRLDYQRKFDSRRQGTFVTNGSQRAVSFFNMVFSKNNNASTSKKKVQNFFSKKLRSTKAIRGAVLENDYRKRFQSQKQKQSFIILYKKTQKRRVSAVSLFKPVALFPQSI
jgi:DNA-directed RNA polymerase beta subunit